MQITGTLKVIKQTRQVSDKFKSREFVIEDNSNTQYPQLISMQCTQDRCVMLDDFNLGDTVTAMFNLKGREWVSPQGEVKYFNTIEAWSIKAVAGATVQSQQPINSGNEDQSLPF